MNEQTKRAFRSPTEALRAIMTFQSLMTIALIQELDKVDEFSTNRLIDRLEFLATQPAAAEQSIDGLLISLLEQLRAAFPPPAKAEE